MAFVAEAPTHGAGAYLRWLTGHNQESQNGGLAGPGECGRPGSELDC